MKIERIDDVIAKRMLKLESGQEILVRIGRPLLWEESGDYCCPYQITGIGNGSVRESWGVDSMQALLLAFYFISSDLYFFQKRDGVKILWNDSADLGFPISE